MLKPVLGMLSQELAVDLGTSNTLIYARGRGVVCREPSLIAVHEDPRGERRVVAVGSAARAMYGRTPGDIKAVRPLRDGVVADFEATEAMLRYFLQRLQGRRGWVGPRMMVCIPFGTTEVEKRAVRECSEAAGARQVLLIEAPLAAALGSGLDITVPEGNMIVDVGGGTTEVAVISMGGIVHSRSLRMAGDALEAAIVAYLQDRHRLLVGPRTAEAVKVELGNAQESGPDRDMLVKGRDLESGYPRQLEVSSGEIREALAAPLSKILGAVVGALERTPPELASDIVDRGIVLTGGGALLRGLDEQIRKETGLPVVMPEKPMTTAAIGAGLALEHEDRFRDLFV